MDSETSSGARRDDRFDLECGYCGHRQAASPRSTVCPECGKPLLVRYGGPETSPGTLTARWADGRGMWRFRDLLPLRDGEEPVLWRYGFSGVLESGEVRVVFGSDSRLWEESNGFPVYGLSLNNSGDTVSLFRCHGTDTVLVDEIVYEDYAADDDRSAGRNAEDPLIWELFDAYNSYSGSGSVAGNGCLPTPGTVNTCVTDAEDSSWGVIKSLYGSGD